MGSTIERNEVEIIGAAPRHRKLRPYHSNGARSSSPIARRNFVIKFMSSSSLDSDLVGHVLMTCDLHLNDGESVAKSIVRSWLKINNLNHPLYACAYKSGVDCTSTKTRQGRSGGHARCTVR